MGATTILMVIGGYFLVLITISFLTSKNSSNDDFFRGGKKSPWFVVAFGMIGASLSGVTFVSIPGVVGAGGQNQQFSYMQVVLGYVLGYAIVANLLLPLYYRLNLTSIYTYLGVRFGTYSNKVGSILFILSRTIGASFRLYLIVIVLQKFLMDSLGVPFYMTTAIAILLIWIYTFRGGIKTIVWTDTLQTLCMLVAVLVAIFLIADSLNIDAGGLVAEIQKSDYSQLFFFEDGWSDRNNFFKQFIGGAFITIVMTGLDQDMMQKNLTCKNLPDAKKNMYTLSISLVFTNILFLTLGALLFIYMDRHGLAIPTQEVGGEIKQRFDLVFPTLALTQFPFYVGVLFLIGLVAAAYSSADSALTSLTTSFSVDFLNADQKDSQAFKKTRTLVHLMFSLLLFVVILFFWYLNDDSVINSLFTAAGYTYGPLLGLFAFGLFTKYKLKDVLVIPVAIIAPIVTFLLSRYSKSLFGGYEMGFELLIVNGVITFLFLLGIVQKSPKEQQ